MELQGNLILDRTPMRRWVSTLAVSVPVAACVVGAAWFIRTFISPPTVAVPSTTAHAATPMPALVRQQRAAPAPQSIAIAEPSLLWDTAEFPTGALSMFSSLVAAPPSFDKVPPASASSGPLREASAGAAVAVYAQPEHDVRAAIAPAAMMEAAATIESPIPLPRPRPTRGFASVLDRVPLLRAAQSQGEARSSTDESERAYDRHVAE
jgi:hypothetical protein